MSPTIIPTKTSTTPRNPEHQRAVAKIYNSAIAACAIPAAWEVGLLDAIQKQGSVDILKFATSNNLDSDSLRGVAFTLATAGVVSYDAATTTISPGLLFEETFCTKSMFHWLTLSSGGLFTRLHKVLHVEQRHPEWEGNTYQRDPAGVAYSCRELNRQFYDPVFWKVVDGVAKDYAFKKVVDLGCGSGERLMQILARFPDANGLGIDVAGPAIDFAESEAKARGFAADGPGEEKRLTFSVGDARRLEARPEFADADLLTSFLMGHDFWPRENCVKTLQWFKKLFPNAKRFLLGDETRGLLYSAGSKAPYTGGDVPIFALGLELGHVLMDVYIPTMEEWYGVFEEGGWRCVRAYELEQPAFAAIFELEPIA
ncbi:methyltransferase MppJ [Podospora didyma]|uniref:Methyltransferase MppJ n=1 Tax=Podospora didyma TaxID=330526 RepID=A0AAE0U0M2_9PEZI|nr:methyltransferase MppJ [Podospora didyma]